MEALLALFPRTISKHSFYPFHNLLLHAIWKAFIILCTKKIWKFCQSKIWLQSSFSAWRQFRLLLERTEKNFFVIEFHLIWLLVILFNRICGPFAVLMSYLSELHGLKYRSRIMLSTGIFFSIGSIILPSLAWMIIPNRIFNINLGNFGNVFILTALISLISIIFIQSCTRGRHSFSSVPFRVY